MSEAAKYGRIIFQIDFIATFCQGIMRGRVFVMFPDLLSTFLPEYEHLFGIPLLLEKGIYVMTHSGKLFDNYLGEFLINNLGFEQSKHKPLIYIKCKDRRFLMLLNYVYDQFYFGSSDNMQT